MFKKCDGRKSKLIINIIRLIIKMLNQQLLQQLTKNLQPDHQSIFKELLRKFESNIINNNSNILN